MLLGRHENSVAITDLSNLSKFIIALVLDVLQEVLILLHGGLLLLYAGLLGFKDGNLLPLAVNLSFLLLVFLSELGDVLVAVAHHFGVKSKKVAY